ncbi:MAG: CNNM domain-containing protein [bacterium]|nr:CNNM domain-containing protein [bacterium]
MDDPSGPFSIFFLAVLLLLSAFFSASETALFATPRRELKKLLHNKPHLAKHINHLLFPPEPTLSAILVGNTLVNVAFTSTITALLLALPIISRERREIIAAGVAFGMLLVFGEIGPKVFASLRPQVFLAFSSKILYYLVKLLRPLSFLQSNVGEAVQMLLQQKKEVTPTSEQLIGTAVRLGENKGTITHSTGQTILNIFAADDTPVRKVMTPRARVQAIDSDSMVANAAAHMVMTGLSRLPVFRGGIDTMIGIIHLKDMLPILKKGDGRFVEVSSLIRPIHRASATDSVIKVMKDLRNRRLHLCAVFNSEDRFIGIATIEDLVEEIVGDITDEHDLLGSIEP